MSEKTYAFSIETYVDVTSYAQLETLLEERCARGTSPETLALFKAWHNAALGRGLASK